MGANQLGANRSELDAVARPHAVHRFPLLLNGVSVVFPDSQDGLAEGERTVLGDITLRVQRGEWLAVVGPNGSGKSVLARVMGGLCAVSRGTVQHTGRTAIVFQNPDAQIIGDTVREDVCFALEMNAIPEPETLGRLHMALSAVGLTALADDATEHLSGGQKQLLASAAAVALLPDVAIFDEATSMLDPAARERVTAVARRLHRRGAAIVWVTQWLEELALADRVIALANGRIVHDGTPAAFFYGDPAETEESPCDRLGFAPPFVVQTARELFTRCGPLPIWPLTPEELAHCVAEL